MTAIGRLLFLAVIAVGIAVGAQRLAEQQVPFAGVAATGILFAGGLIVFFFLLLGLGKLVGRLLGGAGREE